MLLTQGYGSSPYTIDLNSSEWAAFMLPGASPAHAIGTVFGVYWRQDTANSVDTAEVGIAYGSPVPGDNVSLQIVGWVDAESAIEDTAAADTNVTRDVTSTIAVPAGATLWVIFNTIYTGSAPRLVAANVMDPCAAGLVLTRAVTGYLTDALDQPYEFTKQRTRHPVQLAVTVQAP